MPSRDIRERLANGDVLVHDGATGSELQRRGVYVSHGAKRGQLGPWSATANLEAPEIVRAVHEDYLRLGCDIITSNNFWTSAARLSMIGKQDEWERYTRAGAEVAVAARDAINPEAYVAGGIAPPVVGDLASEFRDQVRVLRECGVDLILAEYVGTIADCITAVDVCAESGLPVFLGVRHVTQEGTMQYGETFAGLAATLAGHPVDCVLFMCSDPEHTTTALRAFRPLWPGAIGAYANIGYGINPDFEEDGHTHWHTLDQQTWSPKRYAEAALDWVEIGAQVVGGCCATGPEHIAAVIHSLRGDGA